MKDLGIRIREADFDMDLPVADTGEGTTLGDLMSAARRQYFPVLLCALLGMMFGLAHYMTTPPLYFAQSRVLVEDRISELAAEITANTPLVRNDTALLNEMQVLRSLQLAKVVVQATNLTENQSYLSPPSYGLNALIPNAKAWVKGLIPTSSTLETTEVVLTQEQQQARKSQLVAASLQQSVWIQRVGDSFSIDISMATHDPKLTADLVNAYADAYLADYLNANLQASNRTADWMRNRLDELLETANSASRDAELFRANNKVSDLQGLRELEQRATTLNALHDTIAQRYEQIIIEGSFPSTNGRILNRAITPKNPMSPRLMQILSIATLIGLILGTAIAVLREYGERFFRTGEDVAKFTGLPFLGYLPTFKSPPRLVKPGPQNPVESPKLASEFTTSRNLAAPDDTDAKLPDAVAPSALEARPLDVYAPHLFIPLLEPKSIYSASLRNIHATLEQSMPGKSGAVVAVTSMLPNEGNSTLAANYANMVAKFGARALLIDADMNQPALSAAFNCSDGAGISQVLDGSCNLADAIRKLPETGLDFLPSTFDEQPGITNEALFRQSVPKLIHALRTHYDFVILDLPPLSMAVDTKALLPEIDRIILACEWGETPRTLTRQFMAREPDVARKILGIVLNKVNLKELPKYSSFGSSEAYLRRFSRHSA